MAKKAKNNAPLKNQSKTVSLYSQFKDEEIYRLQPAPDHFVESFFEGMLEEAENNEQILTVYDLLLARKISYHTCGRWSQRNEKTKYLYKLIKEIINNRRYRSAAILGTHRKEDAQYLPRFQLNPHLYIRHAAQYDDAEKESDQHLASLKTADKNTAAGNFTISDPNNLIPKNNASKHED